MPMLPIELCMFILVNCLTQEKENHLTVLWKRLWARKTNPVDIKFSVPQYLCLFFFCFFTVKRWQLWGSHSPNFSMMCQFVNDVLTFFSKKNDVLTFNWPCNQLKNSFFFFGREFIFFFWGRVGCSCHCVLMYSYETTTIFSSTRLDISSNKNVMERFSHSCFYICIPGHS